MTTHTDGDGPDKGPLVAELNQAAVDAFHALERARSAYRTHAVSVAELMLSGDVEAAEQCLQRAYVPARRAQAEALTACRGAREALIAATEPRP